MTHRGTRPHPAPCPNGLKWRITGGGTWQLAQVEPNGYKGIQRICRSELAQRIDTRATDSSAATDEYAALWGGSNPTAKRQPQSPHAAGALAARPWPRRAS